MFVSIQRIKSALIMAAIEISLGQFTQFRNLPGKKTNKHESSEI